MPGRDNKFVRTGSNLSGQDKKTAPDKKKICPEEITNLARQDNKIVENLSGKD